jgi:hypothetical protein
MLDGRNSYREKKYFARRLQCAYNAMQRNSNNRSEPTMAREKKPYEMLELEGIALKLSDFARRFEAVLASLRAVEFDGELWVNIDEGLTKVLLTLETWVGNSTKEANSYLIFKDQDKYRAYTLRYAGRGAKAKARAASEASQTKAPGSKDGRRAATKTKSIPDSARNTRNRSKSSNATPPNAADRIAKRNEKAT